jgi:hydrogenase nickel incorporation protein HypA/HybF
LPHSTASRRFKGRRVHELSIAMSIIEMADEECRKRGAGRVTAVNLRLGVFAGVAKDALLSSYEMACEGTPLAGSRLEIEDVPGMMYCPQCDARRPAGPPEWFLCPQCGSPGSKVVQGLELEVASLEVED